MKNWAGKKGIAIGLSVFVLFAITTSLTGCELGGEEIEEGGGQLGEEEEDD
jgi:hypothetical protein